MRVPLTIWEDEKGLAYRAELNPDDPQARSVFAKINRGDVSQSSFMFKIPEGGETFEAVDEGILYSIRDADLMDVAPVTYPAYASATVSSRTKIRRSSDGTNKPKGSSRASPGIVAKTAFRKLTLKIREAEHTARKEN